MKATKQDQSDSKLELEQLNIDGYQVDEVIQSGGMGNVYQGRQLALDRVVILKLLKKELCSNDIHLERFRREARTGASISHPNVVCVYDAGESSSGDFYFVMEKIHSDLTILLERKKLSLQQVGHLFRQICIGLNHIHEMGILHRDLKPSNLFVDEDLNLKIGDFGIAKHEAVQPIDALTTTNQVLGTPTYMAPELAEPKSKQGKFTDIFALGVILFQMFVGTKGIRPAFTIASVRGRAYQAIDAIVRKATSVCPEHRYREALEMLADFEKVAAKLKKRILIKRCLPYLGAILALAGLGFVLFLLRNS